MKKEILNKAEKLLSECTVCQVASVNREGYPRVCCLLPVKNSGIKTIYFTTDKSSEKVSHFLENDKSGVFFSRRRTASALRAA